MNIEKLPKVELHCHIDGSMSLDIIRKFIEEDREAGKISEYKYNLDEEILTDIVAPKDCISLTQYLTKFELPIKLLQTKERLEDAVYDVLRQGAAENVKYMEVRFAPFYSYNSNLSYNDIYETVIKGTIKAKADFGIHSNIIICAMRQLSDYKNTTMLKAAYDYIGKGICALDLAGDENLYPNNMHVELFNLARDMKIPFVIHSGETGNVENIKAAIEYGAKRIGHGIAMASNMDVIEMCAKHNIGIEMCPTSNLQTKAVTSMNEYPLGEYMRAGLQVSINTDNRTVSDTTLTRELQLINKYFDEDVSALQRLIYENSVLSSFADDSIKNNLLKIK